MFLSRVFVHKLLLFRTVTSWPAIGRLYGLGLLTFSDYAANSTVNDDVGLS
jgi:hypothetical protein